MGILYFPINDQLFSKKISYFILFLKVENSLLVFNFGLPASA